MGPKEIKEIKDDCLRITYKGKKLTINISNELSINETTLNSQLKHLPSNYAFLCLLRDRAIRDRDRLEKRKDAAYSEVWLYYKGSTNVNNDAAAHHAQISPKYQSLERQYLKAQDTAARLISICRAYESRERILQTLSANLRKQQ